MNEEIKAASVDSPKLVALLIRYSETARAENGHDEGEWEKARADLIAHINAWADERCNQLAASRAMLPVTDNDLIHLAQSNRCLGDYIFDGDEMLDFAKRILALATPVAGWVSVEDERKPPFGQQILLFVRTVMYGEDDEGRPFESYGEEIDIGDYRKGEEGNDYFYSFASPFSDNDWITHWQPLPPAPVVTRRSRAND